MPKANPAALSTQLLKRVTTQLGLLTMQFLLGMGVNLIGETQSTAGKLSHNLLLDAHVLVALGLIVNTSLIMHAALKLGGSHLRAARFAAGGIGVGFVAGVLTLTAPGGDWWSYLMAVSFLWAFIFYGRLFLKLGGA
jgi:hypothetical protein